MSFKEIKSLDSQYMIPTYNRFPICIDHGKGATLWDNEGNSYIDLTSGIGVNSIGYANEGWIQAITAQAAKLGHISNLYYSAPYIQLAKTLCTRSGMAKAFFANSGAESNEAMIKLARKYSADKYHAERNTIITLRQSFHGRTITTLSATGQDVFHQHFFPFTDGFRFATANNIQSLLDVMGDDVCAIMVELIQGEGGVLPLEKDYLMQIKNLCDKHDLLLLVDEVQTGIGRTGSLFCYQQYGVLPDVVSFAKGIAGGLPFGGILANESCCDVLSATTHATTFGGNPIAAAAAQEVLRQLDDAAISAVTEKGNYLRSQIEQLHLPCFGATRGLGLMIGIEVQGDKTNRQLAAALISGGVLALTAGDCLRLLPPLTITKEEIDLAVTRIKETLG